MHIKSGKCWFLTISIMGSKAEIEAFASCFGNWADFKEGTTRLFRKKKSNFPGSLKDTPK